VIVSQLAATNAAATKASKVTFILTPAIDQGSAHRADANVPSVYFYYCVCQSYFCRSPVHFGSDEEELGWSMARRKKRIEHSNIVRFFAERLRDARVARGMTQRDLALRAHVAQTYISRLEAAGAAPGIDLLERLARALKASPMDYCRPRVLWPRPLPNRPPDTETRSRTSSMSYWSVQARRHYCYLTCCYGG
jgi:DNA-binding XRE family transcriptional regulator